MYFCELCGETTVIEKQYFTSGINQGKTLYKNSILRIIQFN